MESNSAPTLSVPNYIYVFPAAIWVNQTAALVGDAPPVFAVYVSFVFFAFLPAEVYATELWDRVRSDRAAINVRFWGTLINMVGVFALSLFYLTYPNLNAMYQSAVPVQQGAVLCLGLGLLLAMNGLWNAVERPKHVEVFSLSARAARRRAKELKGIGRAMYSAIARALPVLRWVNFSVFGIVSPATGFGVAFVAGLAVLHVLPKSFAGSQVIAHNMAIFVATFMTVITVFKIFHAYLLISTLRRSA